jgi:hypothetical protein
LILLTCATWVTITAATTVFWEVSRSSSVMSAPTFLSALSALPGSLNTVESNSPGVSKISIASATSAVRMTPFSKMIGVSGGRSA